MAMRTLLLCAGVKARVLEHRWGTNVGSVSGPFDVVVACGMVSKLRPPVPIIAVTRTGIVGWNGEHHRGSHSLWGCPMQM